MNYAVMSTLPNVEILSGIIDAIENEPEYFIPLIYSELAPRMHKHLIRKLTGVNYRLSLFMQAVDVDTAQTVDGFIMARYNQHIQNGLKAFSIEITMNGTLRRKAV